MKAYEKASDAPLRSLDNHATYNLFNTGNHSPPQVACETAVSSSTPIFPTKFGGHLTSPVKRIKEVERLRVAGLA